MTTRRTMTIPKPPLHRPIQTCDACAVFRYTDHNDAVSDYKTDADIIMHNLQQNQNTPIDGFSIMEVSSSLLGGKGIYCSNQHYGTPDQLLRPTSSIDMSDGWETARQPLRPKILQLLKASSTVDDPRCGTLVDFGHLMEYCILELGRPISFINRIVIDTKHFKGNCPESVELAGCSIPEMNHENSSEDAKTESDDVAATSVDWVNDTFTVGCDDNKETKPIHWYPKLDRCQLSPHALHLYDMEQIQFNINHKDVDGITATVPKLSHVRVRIIPDGSLSRIRIYTPTNESLTAHTLNCRNESKPLCDISKNNN